jgi:hypothetical protein
MIREVSRFYTVLESHFLTDISMIYGYEKGPLPSQRAFFVPEKPAASSYRLTA